MQHHDVIIIGGGLVGASLALALNAQTNFQIGLVELKPPNSNDPRLFALSHSSCEFLKTINLLNLFEKEAFPIHQVHVSAKGRFGALRLNREEMNLSALGYVIPAYLIEKALQDQLIQQQEITIYRPAELKTLKQNNTQVDLEILMDEKKFHLTATIVIGADGSDSTVRNQLNIPTKIIDYHQSAIVTRSRLKRSHEQIAYERFYKEGAIAMLPLSQRECATIWSLSSDKAKTLMLLDEDDFLKELQQQFGNRLGEVQALGQRFCFPLRKIEATTMIAGQVILLGNAAHTVHPIAAQGFNLALHEVSELVNLLSTQSILNSDSLKPFEAEIQKRKKMSIGLSHFLPSLFSSGWMSSIIQCGLIGLDLHTPTKRWLMRQII